MANFLCTANLLQKTITYKELKFSQYRQLLKCFLGEEIDSKLIFSNTDNVIAELTNLSQSEIDNLNFLDYCLLLFYIRLTSIGSAVYLYIDDPKFKQLKITLSIDKIINQINNKKIIDLLKPKIINDWSFEFRLPSIKEIFLLESEKKKYSLNIFFIKEIKHSNITINFEKYSYLERENLILSLPVKTLPPISKYIYEIIEFCNNINLLESVKSSFFDKELILTLNSEIIAFIIKLLYNTKLEVVYDYMFALSKVANISCTFLDECSPGEFYVFAKKLEEMNSKSATSSTTQFDDLPDINSEATFDME